MTFNSLVEDQVNLHLAQDAHAAEHRRLGAGAWAAAAPRASAWCRS